jgi:hypothetical protein
MCSKTRSLFQKRDTALHGALHAVLHAFSMSFSLSNLFFDLSTQKPTQRCMQLDVAFLQRMQCRAARLAAMFAAFSDFDRKFCCTLKTQVPGRRLAAHPNCTFKTQV